MVRDARRRAPHHEGPHPEEPALAGVSKDEANEVGNVVAPPHDNLSRAAVANSATHHMMIVIPFDVRSSERETKEHPPWLQLPIRLSSFPPRARRSAGLWAIFRRSAPTSSVPM